MIAGIATAAHMRVVAVAALATGGIVEAKADSQGTARISVGVSGRTVVLNMVRT